MERGMSTNCIYYPFSWKGKSQKSEVRSQKLEVRRQKSEIKMIVRQEFSYHLIT